MNNITYIPNENYENILIYMTYMYISLIFVSIYKYYKIFTRIKKNINHCE